MGLKDSIKKFLFEVAYDPNSSKGLRERAKRLEEKYGPDNDLVTAYKIMADELEKRGK